MLDDLVFLGLNSQRLGLEAPLRAAFSALIDREAVARRAYLGYAAAAWSPIKQSYSPSATGEEGGARVRGGGVGGWGGVGGGGGGGGGWGCGGGGGGGKKKK